MIILSDGGPDHRLCYGSVKVSMIALFLKLNLDMLVCMQMCPYQSWTNPAERVMSTLNLALQNVSLMRDKMDEEMERAISIRIIFLTLERLLKKNLVLVKLYNTQPLL